MTQIQKLAKSQLITEYQQNKRLQWMVLLIICILAISLLKQFSDKIGLQSNQTQSQLDLLARLEKTAQHTIDGNIITSINRRYSEWLESLPSAASASVAEAQALTEIEQNIGKLLKRKRLNLLGSEQLAGSKQVIWQVRVEIAGQLDELNLIELLTHFDNTDKHARIASFQYSPKTSNSINLVIDVIYKRANNA
ncbi:hypothetical protein Patl_3234 [Paraglaciecola sp. T6c]|uniref:hypothetical protein n=1 Tax=Pseudoalteromonas atlantica (strain T6c / ATCC BAA-1087) TaxID=3042615 RepID=UPI00005C51E8|nr:hypothetical protein [Paraglaciecola sp. T6c]ABG41740.1 hypothetical protein Patl_3234 [Paraglaciecola sp. T6c]